MDERIRPMAKAPWWLILHLFILPTRSVKSGRKYGKIWTEAGSPFDVEHAKLRNLLEQRLQGDGVDARVQVGQSYGEDSVQDALAALREQGCTQVVVLPLYPQSAHSTTLSVKDGVAAAMTELSWRVPVAFVDSYGMDSAYIDAIAETVSAAGFNAQAGDRLLFNYHSIPMKDIEQGDTYEPQTGATALAVAVAFVLTERSGPSVTTVGSTKAANGCSRLPEAFSNGGHRREMAVSSWFARISR